MPSVKGRISRNIMYKVNNFNSYHEPDPVGKMKRISQKMENDNCPSGFSRTQEQTPGGTKFERVWKTGTPINNRVILYLHGGAYIAGLFGFYRNFAEDFFNVVGAETIYLDYSTAPEFKYPTQLNEALDLWHHLTQNQGYAPENIIIGGDSAGGHLTLDLLLKLRDNGEKMPLGAFCLSPWADMTASGQSFDENYGKDVEFGDPGQEMTPEKKEFLLRSEIYCCFDGQDRTDPYISPIFADYHGFPPMMFAAGSDEMLLSDTLTIVEKLRKEHIPVICEVQKDMFHIYATLRGLTPESRHSYGRMLNYLRIMFREEKTS